MKKVKQMQKQMEQQKRKSLRKDKKGFTGLEAAIVLTAFIVVAAVFSYMVLGAGFFSTEKAKAVVHTGVEQATSSVEPAGDVIGGGDTTDNQIENVTLYIKLTAGENPVDLGKITISYADEYIYDSNLTYTSGTPTAGNWTYSWVSDQARSPGDGDDMLESDEQVELIIEFPATAGTDTDGGVDCYHWFQVEIKPEQGGVLGVKRTVPGEIDRYTVLN